VEQIQDVLDMNVSELEKPEREVQRDLLLWYYDRWLPVAAGKHWWRDEIRFFKLLTDTQDVAGEQKVNCTITSEAFGFLSYENYYQCWQRQMKHKEQHGPDAPLPKSKTDEDEDGNKIEHYATKWSNSSTGQVKYGGWDEAACTAFDAHIAWVKNFREAEVTNGKPLQKYALKLIQEKNKKKFDKASGKNNKRKKKKSPPSSKKPRMTRLDE